MLLALALAALTADEPPRRATADVQVSRVLVDAVVLDARGNAIPDLTPADFRVRVDGRPAALEAVEWIPAGEPEGPPVTLTGERRPPGRLLVLLVQAPRDGGHMRGLLRTWHSASPLLDSLVATDRVAVLAWRGHLKLLQDFTADRARVREALNAALVGRRRESGPADEPFPALAPALGAEALARTSTMERGLEAIAAALAPIGGSKSVVFVGWGLAVNRSPGENNALARAHAALRAARAAIFTLDPADADYHTLELGLGRLSAATGGFYAKTHLFPQLAVSRVARALAGRYVLVLAVPGGKSRPVEVELLGRRGSVLVGD